MKFDLDSSVNQQYVIDRYCSVASLWLYISIRYDWRNLSVGQNSRVKSETVDGGRKLLIIILLKPSKIKLILVD